MRLLGWEVYREPRDWWVGAYFGDEATYVCVLPTLVARRPPRMAITVSDGPGNMPVGRMLQEQADAERRYG